MATLYQKSGYVFDKLSAMTTPQPFKPTFKKAIGYDSSTGARYLMNDYYYADASTAKWIANRWGNGTLRQANLLGPGGPFGVDTQMYEFYKPVSADSGMWINAGLIAAYYDRNDPVVFPGVAEALIAAQIGAAPMPVLPPKLPTLPVPVRPVTPGAVVEPRTQFGTYPAPGDTNKAGKIIDNPFLSGDEKLEKVVDTFFGGAHYWVDAPAGSKLN